MQQNVLGRMSVGIRSFLLLAGFFLSFSMSLSAQGVLQKKIDARFAKQSLSAALLQLQQQAGVSIAFTPAMVQAYEFPGGNFAQTTVGDVLKALLKNTSLTFKQGENGYVVIVPGPKPVAGTRPAVPVKGHIIDGKTKKPVEGVSVYIQGTQATAMTDERGDFVINVREEESAVMVFSIMGYKTQLVPLKGQTSLSITLQQDVKTLAGVEVAARRRMNTEAAVLDERKKAATISDAISAQNIEKTASITTTQALQRVSGVTITDDKYVAVRGLGDRSVIGQLNGVRLSSSDPDRSTVPLDLVPAGLLDNITVYKTMTPDKPADASGGIVELKTKSIPSRQMLSFTVQTGTNSNIGIGGKVNSYYNSDMGFLGTKVKDHDLQQDFLNLSKQYPNGLAQIQNAITAGSNDPAIYQEAQRVNNIMHHFDPVLTTRYKKAPLNGIYSVTYGNAFKVFKNHQLGVIASASYYSRSTDISNGELNQYSIYQGVMTGNHQIDESRNIPAYITPNTPNLGKYVGYRENTGTQTLNYGFLGGLAYRFNPNNEISFQYLGSRGAETEAVSLAGSYQYTTGLDGPVYSYNYSLKQTYRVFNTYNLQGEHKFGDSKHAVKLSYNAASSKSTQDNPDYRFVNLADYRPAGGGWVAVPSSNPSQAAGYVAVTDHYALVSGYVNGYGPYGKIQADPNGRRFRNLTENNYNYKADVTVPFGFKGLDQALKVGANYLYRERTFNEYVLSLPGNNFSDNKQYPLNLVNGNLDQLVGYDQVGIHRPSGTTPEGAQMLSGFLYDIQKSPNNYKGFYETNAFYGMLDLHPAQNLRLAGGVRFEKTNIQSKVDTADVKIDPSLAFSGINLVYTNPVSQYETAYKPYYSANLTYTLNDQMNFRLAYSTTLARPEIRELTNVFEFDPFQQALVVGNPDLKNQETKSYDFRWEWFPHAGEVFSASVFTKEINHQLEKVFIQNSDGVKADYPEFPTVQFRNAPNTGHLVGVELEAVKDLGLLVPSLQHFFLGSNLMFAHSSIVKNKERLDAARTMDRQSPTKSPLFEQAPYSLNVFMNYANPKSGTDLTATFNMVGERLVQVNLDGSPDLYSRPVPMLDFVFSQKLSKRLLFKGYAKNILNPAYEETYSNPGTGGTYYGQKYVRRSYHRGTEYMVGLTYSLF